MHKLGYVPLPFDRANLPEGWFSKYQVNILFQLVNLTRGPILEVGPWIGRSTAVICEALKLQESRRRFVTVDYGICSEQDWEQRFGEPVTNKSDPARYLCHINQPDGNLTSLKKNLSDRGFADLVEIRRGDFLHEVFDTKFSLIFCDATHDNHEIDRNIPSLLSLLAPGGILACDDIRDEQMVRRILSHTGFLWTHLDHSLFYGRPKHS